MQVDSHTHQNLYEIPNCTICLNQMNQDMANLECGHVFHHPCITQHFEYRGTCPNCQKRSFQKEIRTLVFPLQKNIQSTQLMRHFLGNLSLQEKQQVKVLFKQVESLTQNNERLQKESKKAQEEARKAVSDLYYLNKNFNDTLYQLDEAKKDSVEMRKVVDHLHFQIKGLKQKNFNIRQTLLEYKEIEAQYEKVKKYTEIMHETGQKIIDYKNELEKRNTSPTEMAQQFFDMILIKNLEVFNLKNKLQSFPQKLADKEEQISRLESQLQRARRQAKDGKQKATVEKKKYEELRQKYRKLYAKYKQKCEEHSEEGNYEDSMSSGHSAPQVNTSRMNSTESGHSSFEMNENSELNVPMGENRMAKKSSQSRLNERIEWEKEVESVNQQQKKGGMQVKTDSLLNKKPAGKIVFPSFGGVKPNKNAQQMKKPAPFKNLFD